MKSMKNVGIQSHHGSLDAIAAASGIQAARSNGLDLIDSADVLFGAERYSHATSLSILAIEELGKPAILLTVFLEGGTLKDLWRQYRHHTAKTQLLNFAIGSLAEKHFASLPKDILKKAGEGPTPSDLEAQKQLSLYSDIFADNGHVVCHLPSNLDWKAEAHTRICEARALAHNIRDYPPEELVVWHRHLHPMAQKTPAEISRAYKGLAQELEGRGFIKRDAWKTILGAVHK